jgi:polysaccharide chain length determinant protein (PEP-CTERM system associated)
MLGHRELTMQDYAAILKRRCWLIFTCPIVALGIGLALTCVLPPRYVSQTLVLIEQQKVPEDYVKPVVNEDLNARLASMKEQILSRSRIEPIIERFNLHAGKTYTMDDRVELTRKDIGINPIRSDQARGGMPGFFISFAAQDARTAQQVCGEITSLFVSENLNAREQSAQGTTDFLKQQLADAKRNLDDQDEKLAAFERKYIGKLPNQETANTNTLQALTTQLEAATQAVSRAEQEIAFLEALVNEQSQSRVDPVSASSDNALTEQLKELKKQKEALDALYTPDHPDVVAVAREIASIQDKIRHQPTETPKQTAAENHSDPPQIQENKARLRVARQSLVSAREEQSRIQRQINIYEARIEQSPVIEQEYKQITRDHETALQFYNTLLTKMNESSMATALEQRQQGEQFRVMDAPNLPDEPKFPNRKAFTGGGLAAGFVFALLLAALLEYRDKSVRTDSDIWAFTKLPTLVVLSYINELPQKQDGAKRLKLLSRRSNPVEVAGGQHV